MLTNSDKVLVSLYDVYGVWESVAEQPVEATWHSSTAWFQSGWTIVKYNLVALRFHEILWYEFARVFETINAPTRFCEMSLAHLVTKCYTTSLIFAVVTVHAVAPFTNMVQL